MCRATDEFKVRPCFLTTGQLWSRDVASLNLKLLPYEMGESAEPQTAGSPVYEIGCVAFFWLEIQVLDGVGEVG